MATALADYDFPSKKAAQDALDPSKNNDDWNDSMEEVRGAAALAAKKEADKKGRAPKCENPDCDCNAGMAELVKDSKGNNDCGADIVEGKKLGTFNIQWYCWANRAGNCVTKANAPK